MGRVGNREKTDRGAGLVEYAALILFIAVVGIIAIKSSGGAVAEVFEGVVDEIDPTAGGIAEIS